MKTKKQTIKEIKNKFDVWEHFSEWEGWTCNYCDELIESSEGVLINHLLNKHKIKFKEENENKTNS